MPFFDTHTHLDYLQQQLNLPINELIINALQQQVEKILIVSVKSDDFARIENIAKSAPDTFRYGLGLHPLYIEQHQQQDINRLQEKLKQKNKQLTAIAEIGLDRHEPTLLTTELWNKQQDYFEKQLMLAKHFKLAINVHSRKSHDVVYSFLKHANLDKHGVIHGFSGSYQQAKNFVDLGYKIGVGGVITYKRATKTRSAISRLPLSSLLLETDAPDMPVHNFQGQPNRPERIINIYHTLCQIRSESPEIIAQTIWQNSLSIFN